MANKKNSFKKEKTQLLESLLQQATKKGYIRASTIESRFARYYPSEAEIESYYRAFEEKGIDIIDSEDNDDYILSEAFANSDNDEQDIDIPASTSFSSSLTDPLQLYLNEIHKFPMLTHKETLALTSKVIAGDMDAREYLINCNLKYAFAIALKYAKTGFPILDLIQQANMGLMKAVDKYNPHRGAKFSSYAVFWMKFYIMVFIKENLKLVNVPKAVFDDLVKIKALSETFYLENFRNPTDTELAELSGMCISRIKYLKSVDYDVISMDEEIGEDNEHTIGELIPADEYEDNPHREFLLEDFRKAIGVFLEQLSEKERTVLILHYGLGGTCDKPMTLEQIGHRMGFSKERARQIETRAINKLRKMQNISSLKYFLDI